MEGQQETTQARVIQIGPDRVTTSDKEVVIEAKHEMPDWDVRDFNVIPIYFENKKYYLVQKGKAQKPYTVRYLLLPWKDGQFQAAKFFQTYDAETVAERDSTRRSGQRAELAGAYLLMFYPFLGLLWSGTQQRLVRFGFVPRGITGASIFLVFALGFGQLAFTSIMVNASARSGSIMIGGLIRAMTGQDYLHLGPVPIPVTILDCLLLVSLVVDAAARYTHYLRESEWTGGFLEWLFTKPQRRM